jgi:hypothetical protein
MPERFAPLPGDTIGLPGERPADQRGLVETVYLCSEPNGPSVPGSDDGGTAGDVTRWSWIVLSDGRLLEIAPRGCAIYGPPQLLTRGSGPFLELVAQDGALIRFEERVRAGTWQARPVRLTLDHRRWRVTSTGTVTPSRLGATPMSAWGQLDRSPNLSPSPVEPDVYFTLAGLADAEVLGLGLWAQDICLAFGRRLGDTPSAAGLRILTDPA